MVKRNDELIQQERLESFKAGVIGAIALVFGFLLMVGVHLLWRHIPALSKSFVPVYGIGLEGIASGAIALVSGFLFGVTYRYIIRTDTNPQLKLGAIGAFGLIRGLSLLDMGIVLHGNRWLLALLVGESMVMMAIAQMILDWSMRRSLLRPFESSSLP